MTVAMLAGLVLAAATAQDGAAAQPQVAAPPAQTDPAARLRWSGIVLDIYVKYALYPKAAC